MIWLQKYFTEIWTVDLRKICWSFKISMRSKMWYSKIVNTQCRGYCIYNKRIRLLAPGHMLPGITAVIKNDKWATTQDLRYQNKEIIKRNRAQGAILHTQNHSRRCTGYPMKASRVLWLRFSWIWSQNERKRERKIQKVPLSSALLGGLRGGARDKVQRAAKKSWKD